MGYYEVLQALRDYFPTIKARYPLINGAFLYPDGNPGALSEPRTAEEWRQWSRLSAETGLVRSIFESWEGGVEAHPTTVRLMTEGGYIWPPNPFARSSSSSSPGGGETSAGFVPPPIPAPLPPLPLPPFPAPLPATPATPVAGPDASGFAEPYSPAAVPSLGFAPADVGLIPNSQPAQDLAPSGRTVLGGLSVDLSGLKPAANLASGVVGLNGQSISGRFEPGFLG